MCLAKAQNPKWGKRKIAEHVNASKNVHVEERRVQQHLDKFLYDENLKRKNLYVKSTELNVCHRECVSRE